PFATNRRDPPPGRAAVGGAQPASAAASTTSTPATMVKAGAPCGRLNRLHRPTPDGLRPGRLRPRPPLSRIVPLLRPRPARDVAPGGSLRRQRAPASPDEPRPAG